jgi:nucleoside-diphosphate-sugar epimerase
MSKSVSRDDAARGTANPWNQRSVLVTGGTGFVGAHLVRRLVGAGARVTVLVRGSSDLWRLASVLDHVAVVRSDFEQLSTGGTAERIASVDVVYHLAAAGTNQAEHDPVRVLNGNVLGTYQVLELSQRLRARRVVCAGTGVEYGVVTHATEDSLPRPLNVYAASKAAAWLFAHTYAARYDLSLVTLRTFSVYGPTQSPYFLIPYVILRAIANEPIALTGGTQNRDFVYIDDVVDAFVAAADGEVSGETFNVSTDAGILVRDVVATIVSVAGSRSEVVLGARPYSAHELWSSSGSYTKIEGRLGWSPRTLLQDGLAVTIDWFREHRQEYAVHYPGA